ncbi:SDR family oxidoreductase [Microbacterium sp. BK668]|uniref:SDR family oxidoreductase n=1 Tax=Microbacterium sp. BK668 TaxID=2512118 RepID=UPI00105B2B2E|nr:SDR family oxidoreductase [Microbacterium sp. BK668]TDN91576.1 NAD(P)-dependent dehydrogenase (short-subunit alcohol dehydrogenase family) [Microbacterium sp. BK668]
MSAALVTGAGHGIGAAAAVALARRFDIVVVSDVDADAAAEVAHGVRGAGGHAVDVHLDVGHEASWQAVRRRLDEAGVVVSAVVNNAFTLTVAPAHELTAEAWDQQVSVNLGAVYRSVRTFHDTLHAERGSIVNVASVHAVAGFPGHPAYAAAKGGVVALTRQLAIEYAPSIRVNAVLPGSILTRAWDRVPEADRQEHLGHIPLGRFGDPADVAAAIAFLAGPESSYITATTLLVDGGLTASV